MRISLIQMKVLKTPTENIEKIKKLVGLAKEQGADIAVLPEMCVCAYENSSFVEYAMDENSDTVRMLSCIARDNGIYLIAGSIPEKDNDNIYNTSFVFAPSGERIAKHRKMHLFDIDVENGQYFKESDTFSYGNDVTVFETKWGKIGVMICYDIRFPELSRLMADDVTAVIVPASFNYTTGPEHWELLFRCRAVDNQIYMMGCASATDDAQSYRSWGHSIITDPWGRVVKQLGTEEDILTCDIDPDYCMNIRKQLPLLKHRRRDIY